MINQKPLKQLLQVDIILIYLLRNNIPSTFVGMLPTHHTKKEKRIDSINFEYVHLDCDTWKNLSIKDKGGNFQARNCSPINECWKGGIEMEGTQFLT